MNTANNLAPFPEDTVDGEAGEEEGQGNHWEMEGWSEVDEDENGGGNLTGLHAMRAKCTSL